MEKNLKLHTFDIQRMMIILIGYRDFGEVITEADVERYLDTLGELNQMCTEENGHELDITIHG